MENKHTENPRDDLYKTLNKLVRFFYLLVAYVIPILVIAGVFIATVIQSGDNGINPLSGIVITLALGFGLKVLWEKLK